MRLNLGTGSKTWAKENGGGRLKFEPVVNKPFDSCAFFECCTYQCLILCFS
jgi:hypothetical protein